jgi:hypothetical protein
MTNDKTLAEIYNVAKELYELGLIDRDKLREFFEICFQQQVTANRESRKKGSRDGK